ncbi:RNA methyltransferase [Candidatus Babeliales bacterium]|nr:RNA methyltransferase [Candidatus Babeliales bacterium]
MHHKKRTKEQKGELIYGPHAIKEMLLAKKRRLMSIYTTKPLPKAWNRIKQYLPKKIPNIQYVSKDILAKIAGTSDHAGIVALVSPFKYATKIFDPKNKPFILLLDAVQDVRNLGAILRSAYCTGADGIVICKKGAASLTPAAFKASAGLAEYLNIYQAPSINAAVREIKAAGYSLYMAVLEGENALTVKYKKPLCLVIGSESIGISKDVQKEGKLITLPQKRPDISYNASVAAGILLFILSEKVKA